MQDARCALDGRRTAGELSCASNAMCRIRVPVMSDVRRAWGRESQYPRISISLSIRRNREIFRKTLDVSSLGSILRDFEMSRPYPPESRAFESLIFRRFRNMPPGGLLVVKSQYLFGNASGDGFSDSGLNISEGGDENVRN